MLDKRNQINAWVTFSFNYPYYKEWIGAIWGTGASGQHLMSKFEQLAETYGADSVINRFYAELSKPNQDKLSEWVVNTYMK